jgi:hypothetical protein
MKKHFSEANAAAIYLFSFEQKFEEQCSNKSESKNIQSVFHKAKL